MRPRVQTTALTLLALVAFAFNSLLTRMALSPPQIDPAIFTFVRLASGALALGVIVRVRAGAWAALGGRGVSGPLALAVYAAAFTFAYVRIGAAVGALVLFGMVQLTMIGWGISRGERPSVRAWAGIAVAATGLGMLTVPAASRPDPLGVGLMGLAGVAWGVYSLLGKRAFDALAANARSFLWSLPVTVLLGVFLRGSTSATFLGLAAAVTSGAVTSGLGYAIWYRALRGLTTTQAAVCQLGVPVIAAFGAVALLDEALTPRLFFCGVTVLCGLGLVLSDGHGRTRKAKSG